MNAANIWSKLNSGAGCVAMTIPFVLGLWFWAQHTTKHDIRNKPTPTYQNYIPGTMESTGLRGYDQTPSPELGHDWQQSAAVPTSDFAVLMGTMYCAPGNRWFIRSPAGVDYPLSGEYPAMAATIIHDGEAADVWAKGVWVEEGFEPICLEITLPNGEGTATIGRCEDEGE